MSPSLLSKRLISWSPTAWSSADVTAAKWSTSRPGPGEELRSAIELLGAWGMRWTGVLGDVDLDPKLLMWDLHRNVDRALVPAGTTVVRFDFTDVSARQGQWWIVLTPDEVDVCDADPGHDLSATVAGSLRSLVEIWRGDRTWIDALRAEVVTITGPEPIRRLVPAGSGPATSPAFLGPIRSSSPEPNRCRIDRRVTLVAFRRGATVTAYWINTFTAIRDADKLAAYVALSGRPSSPPVGSSSPEAYPKPSSRVGSDTQRVVRFPSVEAAVAAYHSPAYQEALVALGDGADRDIRIVPAVEGFLAVHQSVNRGRSVTSPIVLARPEDVRDVEGAVLPLDARPARAGRGRGRPAG